MELDKTMAVYGTYELAGRHFSSAVATLTSPLYSIFLESSASESASRRTAMKNATDNATDLANNLSREANQARQAKITQEITEIIGGAGALSGSGESD